MKKQVEYIISFIIFRENISEHFEIITDKGNNKLLVRTMIKDQNKIKIILSKRTLIVS